MRHWFLSFLLLGACLGPKAQVNTAALPWKNNTAYNSYLMRTVHQQYADRLAEVAEAVTSKKSLLRYQQTRRARYQSILGDMPAKAALNAHVVGTLPQKGFHVERIVFESMPHRYVTANLYLPEGKGPFPVTLSLSGHGPNGKAGDQRVGALFALHGIAVLLRTGQMPVPCLVLTPEKVSLAASVVLYLNAAGKETILADEATVGTFMNRGDILVLADLRGFGETADPVEYNDLKYWSKEYRNAMLGLHIGESVMGQRVLDVFSLADFMTTTPGLQGHDIKLVANGLYGPAAIHAAYLDSRIKTTEVARSCKSFEQLLQNPLQNDACTNVLYGVLKYYDLPDLMHKAGGSKIRFVD